MEASALMQTEMLTTPYKPYIMQQAINLPQLSTAGGKQT